MEMVIVAKFFIALFKEIEKLHWSAFYYMYRDRGAIFGLRGPNAELPTGRETGLGSEFTGLRQ